MAYTVQFLLMLVATMTCGTVALVQTHNAVAEGERLLGVLVLVALPLVLGQWFRRLRSEDPPIWWELRQRLPGATGERLPVLEPTGENPFFPLPWFLLPLIPISVSLGVVTEHTVLFWAPVAATVVWVGMVGVVVAAWAARHRAKTSGLERMLADFRQRVPLDGTGSHLRWAHRVFDMHRPTMDDVTLEALYGVGVEDAHGPADRWPRVDVTRLRPWCARQGWLCVLEEEGLIERDESGHRVLTDPPREMQGWQCPRCHTMNERGARRCTLSAWDLDMTPLCRERRPGFSWIANEVSTIVEIAVGVVFMVLVFGPLLLAILAVHGVLALYGSGDPAGLVAAALLTAAWLFLIRLPVALAREARESLEMLLLIVAAVLLTPFIWPVVALRGVVRRVRRAHAPVEVVVDGPTLVVNPRIVKPGRVALRISNKTPDADVPITIVRTDYRPGSLPDDLDRYLTGRPDDAVVVGRGWGSSSTSETKELSLTPGRYVIAASKGPGGGHWDVRMISTLLVESPASKHES